MQPSPGDTGVNLHILDALFRRGEIFLERGALFDSSPPPKPEGFDFGRVEGMLLGVAIGDSLGVTTESIKPDMREVLYGEIRDYLPNRHTGECRGYPSDDTQLTFWALEELLEDGGLVPENLRAKFSGSGKIYGIGSAVLEFLRNATTPGMPWQACGARSAGNGALMRVSPFVLPHLRSGGPGLWADTALAAMVTHNDPTSTSACLAFLAMLWDLLDMTAPPPPEWWARRYAELAADLEGCPALRPRGGAFSEWCGPLHRFVAEKAPVALEEGWSVRDACDRWWSGAYLLETVPSVLHVLALHADDPEEALVRAVNDTKDNDTVAAIVGAAVGALHGKDALPPRWIENLSGRTRDNDDRRVFELIEGARRTFWDRT